MSPRIAFITDTIQKCPLRILLLAFVGIQVVLYLHLGVNTGMEADKYVAQGTLLYETGSLSESKFIFYLPVILLVWFCKWLSLPLAFVVLVQVVVSALAQYCFYKLVARLASRPVAFLSSLLLVLFVPLQAWNFFLYSDSFFISFTLLYAWAMFRFAAGGWKGKLVILFFLLLLVIARPHGLLFIPPTILYLLIIPQTRLSRIRTALGCAALLAIMYGVMNMIFTGGSDMDALKPFVEEHIICFVPQKPAGADLDVIHSNSPVADLFYYVWHNPLHFGKLMVWRLYSFFNLTRDFYSQIHNVLLLLFMIPVYLLAIFGIRTAWRHHRPFVYYLLLVLVLYPLGATFQCDDWHSRFTMVVMPFIIFFAALYAVRFMAQLQKNRTP